MNETEKKRQVQRRPPDAKMRENFMRGTGLKGGAECQEMGTDCLLGQHVSKSRSQPAGQPFNRSGPAFSPSLMEENVTACGKMKYYFKKFLFHL